MFAAQILHNYMYVNKAEASEEPLRNYKQPNQMTKCKKNEHSNYGSCVLKAWAGWVSIKTLDQYPWATLNNSQLTLHQHLSWQPMGCGSTYWTDQDVDRWYQCQATLSHDVVSTQSWSVEPPLRDTSFFNGHIHVPYLIW